MNIRDNQLTYFDILGVDVGASPEDIRLAYRRKARLYHPDYNVSPKAAERFLVLKNAYDILKNPETRKSYQDQLVQSVNLNQDVVMDIWKKTMMDYVKPS